MPVPHQTGRVKSGDVTLFFRRLGKPGGVPFLIVHGLSYFSWDWLGVAQTLGKDREVICMDMRGFGDSESSPQKDYAVPTMGGDILGVLDQAGWRRALLVGHSMGGRSTTWLAAKHPGRVAGLALIDYSPENAPAGSKRVTQIVANTPERFASVEAAMQYFNSTNRERFEAYLRKEGNQYVLKRDLHFRDQFKRLLETGERPKLGVDMWQLLGEVRCPILSMRGSRSDMYAAETMEKMKGANPRLSVVEVDAGHNIAGENPQGFVAALRPFLGLLEENHAHERR